MEKKKLTGDELKQSLLGRAVGFIAGGLTCSLCGDDLLFLGLCLALGGFGWLFFKEDLKTNETPEIIPFDNNNRQF